MKPLIKRRNWIGPRRLAGLPLALLSALWLCALPVKDSEAHPLGNFSISQYSAIRIEPKHIELRYLVDMAEIPTFQELQENNITAETNHPSLPGYLTKQAETLKRNLQLEINGRRLALQTAAQEVVFPAGAGGLPTLKLAMTYRAQLAGTEGDGNFRLRYADRNFPERLGWKEIVATTGAGVTLQQSSVPERDRSAALSNYPEDLLNRPPQVLAAAVDFSVPLPTRRPDNVVLSEVVPPQQTALPAAVTAAAKPANTSASEAKTSVVASAPAPAQSERLDSQQSQRQDTPRSAFTELMLTQQWSVTMLLFAFVVAAGLGALHALEPGHGKTLVAAYLVGSRGTMKHALWLGLIVTVAHTAGVYLLGAMTLYASQYILPEKLYPWLALASGLMILALGCVLFWRRYRGGDAGHHHHDHSHHDHHHHHGHSHAHSHSHGHHHHHAPKEVSLKQLLTLGISGGIVPCPAALVVLLSAVSMQRIGFGLALIVAFSVGLAAVLVGIGLLIVYAKQFAARFHGGGALTTRWLPLTSSAFIVVFGLALTWQALHSAGFRSFLAL